MHLLSTRELQSLVGGGLGRWLDVGAGAGYVTQHAAALCGELVCTETSHRLAGRLRKRGFEVLEQDLGESPLAKAGDFDVVLCLNVLDRTSHPRRLLAALRTLCAPHTRLLVALPLPLSSMVFVRGGSVEPSELLPSQARSFEAALVELSHGLFEPAGFRIERLARVPYLSVGDTQQPMYVLDDGLWVLRPA